MEANRKLDALIGKEIVGLDVEPSSKYAGWYEDLIPIGNREFIDPQGWVYDKGRKPVPWYSGNLFAAFELAEITDILVDHNLSQTDDGTWMICDWDGFEFARADTVPLVICLAVVKDRGIEFEGD